MDEMTTPQQHPDNSPADPAGAPSGAGPTDDAQAGRRHDDQSPAGRPYGDQSQAGETYGAQPAAGQPYGQPPSTQPFGGQPPAGHAHGGRSHGDESYVDRSHGDHAPTAQTASGHYTGPVYAPQGYGAPLYSSAGSGGGTYPPQLTGLQSTGPQPGGPQRGVRSRRRRTGIAALAVAGCLVAGTAGGALGVELADNGTPLATRSVGSTSAAQVSVVNGTVQAAAAKIIPSTVVIEVTNGQEGGTGSGIILDTSGNIVTNAHVVTGLSRATIQVTLSDGRTAPATLVGVDASSDLAVIKIDDVSGLQPATFADSDDLVIGQTVVAVGAPLGLSGTVTQGIVSAMDRPVRTGESADESTVLDAVQTDAAINPGNSGGPLVNLAGEVVGINSAIASVGQTSGQSGNIGVGFAIPSDDVTNTADQLLADGTAEHASLGISASQPRTAVNGALVQDVDANSAAAQGGLERGDIITKLDDRAVVDLDSLLAAVRDHEPGDTVTLTVERDGDEQTLTVTLGSRAG